MRPQNEYVGADYPTFVKVRSRGLLIPDTFRSFRASIDPERGRRRRRVKPGKPVREQRESLETTH